MSETGNPLMYGWNDAVAITEDGEGLTIDQLRDLHWSETDRPGIRQARDPDATYITFLLESRVSMTNWGDDPKFEVVQEPIYLPSRNKLVKVINLPLEAKGFELYLRGSDRSCEGPYAWEGADIPCHNPTRTLVNGWSAGPTPFCSKHLPSLTRGLGHGLRWRPVRLRYEDVNWIERHSMFWGMTY